MTTGPRSLLELENVHKRFGDVVANDEISMHVAPGEVVSMLGENGAGKSTLMKITYGLVRADSGSVRVEGKELDLRSPRDAMKAGIGMVTQEFSLVNTMTVAENISLSGIGFGNISASELKADVLRVMDRVGVHLDPDQVVESLSIGERQRVEIIKALYHDCKVLILDEPTAVLTPQDIKALFVTIRKLRESNLGVLFVSHKLREVKEISDRVVVLRHGRLVADKAIEEVTSESLASLMMGVTHIDAADESAAIGADEPVVKKSSSHPTDSGIPTLEVKQLSLTDNDVTVLDDISLRVNAKEIVGIAGISGNGQSQLVDVLSGVLQQSSGSISVAGTEISQADVRSRLKAGLGRFTEDRRGTTFAAMTVEQNLVIEDLEDFRKNGMLNRKDIRKHAEKLINKFSIKARPTDLVGNLSGGNIQKVLIARALNRSPRVLIAAQPTRGLDIGTYGYVHEQLRDLRDSGAGVLLISEDLDELRALSDRILVIFRGRIVGELDVAEATSERLGVMMTGGLEESR